MAGEIKEVFKDENLSSKHKRVQEMLPWGFETKLASVLGLIKLPFIFLCCGIGLFAEQRLKSLTVRSWERAGNGEWLWGTVTGCYAHELRDSVPSEELVHFRALDWVNSSLGGSLTSDVWKSETTLDPWHLMQRSTCEIDVDTCSVRGLSQPGYFTGGIAHWIPFSLVWLIYKLVFIGIHPIDRLTLALAGNPPSGEGRPEPILKLLTEPYYQFCTTPMRVVVKFLFYFRYKMLPNALFGVLASMQYMGPDCPKLVHYTMSPTFGNAAYYLCLSDLFVIASAYWYFRVKMEGKMIGRWRYRLWKSLWLVSAIFFASISLRAASRTFGGIQGALESCLMAPYMILTLNVSFRLNVDLLKVMTFLILVFEGLELAFLVVSIVGPKVRPEFFKQFKWLRSESTYDELPDDEFEEAVGSTRPSPPVGAAATERVCTAP